MRVSESTSIQEFLLALLRVKSTTLMIVYLLIVFCAKFWIRNVKRIEIREFMAFYNFAISFVNFYTFTGFLYHVIRAESYMSGQTNDLLKQVFYVYWISKIFELLDTFFMIIRHRGRQISFLHVFHHASMLVLTELAYRKSPVVSVATFLCVNSFIHIVLYFYYGLSVLNPDNPPKWKKILTQMQIIQFVFDVVASTYGYFHGAYCIYGVSYGVILLYMFSSFYYQAYVKPKKT